MRHTTGKHRTRTDAQATPEPASRTCHVLRLLSVLESSKPCPHCRQRPETPPANPRNRVGVGWGYLLSRSSGSAGPVSYVMARQGGVLLPLTPPRRKERPKVSATGAHDSSSCVLKCSLDKSRPASPRRTPSASRGPASQGAAWTKELETHDGQASNPHGRTSHARTCKQNLSCLATVVRAGKLETVPALPSTTREHPS